MISLRLKLLQNSRETEEERFERAYQFFKHRMVQLLLELEHLPLGPSCSHSFPAEFTGACWARGKILRRCCERFMKEGVTDLKLFVSNPTGIVCVNWSPEVV